MALNIILKSVASMVGEAVEQLLEGSLVWLFDGDRFGPTIAFTSPGQQAPDERRSPAPMPESCHLPVRANQAVNLAEVGAQEVGDGVPVGRREELLVHGVQV